MNRPFFDQSGHPVQVIDFNYGNVKKGRASLEVAFQLSNDRGGAGILCTVYVPPSLTEHPYARRAALVRGSGSLRLL
jgi:hypothetical protein